MRPSPVTRHGVASGWCNLEGDRPDILMPGHQVEAPRSHLIDLRVGGSLVRLRPVVLSAAAVLPVILGAPPVAARGVSCVASGGLK